MTNYLEELQKRLTDMYPERTIVLQREAPPNSFCPVISIYENNKKLDFNVSFELIEDLQNFPLLSEWIENSMDWSKCGKATLNTEEFVINELMIIISGALTKDDTN